MLKRLSLCLLLVLILSCISYAERETVRINHKSSEAVEGSAPSSYRFYKDIPSMLIARDAGIIVSDPYYGTDLIFNVSKR